MASSPTTHTISSFVHLYILFLLATTTTAQKWDGVVITQADLQGLQAFKHQLEDPRGVLHTWNGTGLGACSGAWLGIKCVKGQVIAISLPWKGLAGAISNSVGQLRALRKLSLHDNAIAGRIPAALGFLPNLRGVYLFNNRLSGAIPPGIGKSPVLQTLDLSNNSLVGTVPPGIGSSGKILRINLAFNLLVGGLPVGLTRSPSLEFLSVRSNNLSGFIPDTWGGAAVVTTAVAANIPVYQLQTLILDNNAFSGPLPASLGRLPALQVLTFTNNQLNGSIPPELFNATSLTVLDGASNHLDGPLPDAVGNLRNLSVLSLTANNLLGPIPATLGNDTALTKLDLSSNNFSGNIPDSLDRLASLTSFDVSNNTLSGPVPLPLAQNFNASSFRGNLQLCGYALDVPCPPSTTPAAHPSSPAPAPATHRRTRKLSTREIVLIAAGSVLAVLLVLVCVMLCCLIRKRAAAGSREVESGKKSPTAAAARGEKSGTAEGAEAGGGGDAGGKLVHFDGPLAFTADDLLCATAEIMGKSTYGTVYRATLEDGSQVAVKRLREKITKGQKEFELEVSTLGRIRHRNLLALRAYYLGPKGEKLLVFDYMPKGSLTSFLHARAPDTPVDWPTRMRIAIGATRGLLYLHTHCNMVHGNLTSSNILLDNSANPKIADYGLSRLMTAAANSSVIAAAGALGYRAPELSKLKKASTKTDVYSLGVILLELLTGKSPGEAMNGVDLPQWVASIVKEEWTNEVFDLELMRDEAAGGGAGDELLNTLKLALHCVDPSASARPEVQQVLHQLEEIKPELAGEEAAAGASGTEAATTSTASVGGEGHGAAAGHSKDGA